MCLISTRSPPECIKRYTVQHEKEHLLQKVFFLSLNGEGLAKRRDIMIVPTHSSFRQKKKRKDIAYAGREGHNLWMNQGTLVVTLRGRVYHGV